MKKFLFSLLLTLCFGHLSYAQDIKHQLSSHILDITTGKPASNVKITLSKQDKFKNWITIDEKLTDKNGRIKDFLQQTNISNIGIYKLTFHTSEYFNSMNQKSFYPFIEVVFELSDDEHYHVPITLSPFGYSTYRGN